MNMKKITLLLLGIINVIGIGLVSPVMNQFAADFPQVSSMAVQLLTHSIEKAYILFGVVVFVLGYIDVVLVLRERNEEFV